jgi:hypothetical protein
MFIRPGKQGTFNTFGWMVAGAKTEYLTTDKLVLEGSIGGFWTAEKTACSARFRIGSVRGPCALPALDFTGNSRYAGTRQVTLEPMSASRREPFSSAMA